MNDLTADQRYAADLAETLEQLLSVISLMPGEHKSDYLRNAVVNANNILSAYQIELDAEDAAIKQANDEYNHSLDDPNDNLPTD